MTTRIFHTALSLLAILTLLALPATSQGQYFEDFDTGFSYAAGPLDGQNGWVNIFGSGMDINLTGGKTGAGAFDNDNGNLSGSVVPHGVPIELGSTYTISADMKTKDRNFWEIGIRSDSGGLYILAEILFNDPNAGNTGFRLDVQGQIGAEVRTEDLSIPVFDDQWYHQKGRW